MSDLLLIRSTLASVQPKEVGCGYQICFHLSEGCELKLRETSYLRKLKLVLIGGLEFGVSGQTQKFNINWRM